MAGLGTSTSTVPAARTTCSPRMLPRFIAWGDATDSANAAGLGCALTAVKPNENMSMSPEAKARMRATEKAVYKYYNDMGKSKGHCTWGAGILAHKGVCS
jgi:hypothetical protein